MIMNHQKSINESLYNTDTQMKLRSKKLREHKGKKDKDMFGSDLKNITPIKKIIDKFREFTKKQLENCKKNKGRLYTVNGRIILRRIIGKISFIKLF